MSVQTKISRIQAILANNAKSDEAKLKDILWIVIPDSIKALLS